MVYIIVLLLGAFKGMNARELLPFAIPVAIYGLSYMSPWMWWLVNSLFGVFCGIGFGCVYVLSRDKALFKSIFTGLANAAQDRLMSSPHIVGAIMQIVKPANELIAMITVMVNGKKVLGGAKLVNGKVMRVSFTYRQKKWKAYIKCDTEQEDSGTKWLVDGKDLKHCPMLPFDVTANDLGVSSVEMKQEEEIVI